MSNEVSKRSRYTNGGNLDYWRGPYSSVAAANAAIADTTDDNGVNLRAGKIVDIGTHTSSVEHRWVGGFANANLVPVNKDRDSAISGAQTTANNALTNAATAQSTANTALAKAEVALVDIDHIEDVLIPAKADKSAIKNDLTTGGANNILSAQQGVVLNARVTKNSSDINATSVATKNLFNYADPGVVRGYYIQGDGPGKGNISVNPTYSVTGFIPINAGQTLHSNKSQIGAAFGVNLYDINQVLVTTNNNTANAVATVNGYARFTLNVTAAENISAAGVQIENGTDATSVVPFGRNVLGETLVDESVSLDKLSPTVKSVLAKTPILENKIAKNEVDISAISIATKNLFNYADAGVVRGFYIQGDGAGKGNISANSSYSVTGFIPINAGQTLHSNKSQVGAVIGVNLYDTNQVLVATNNNTANAVATVNGFARFTLNVTAAENIAVAGVQIENGTVATTVVPFGRNVLGETLVDESVSLNKLSPAVKTTLSKVPVLENKVGKIESDINSISTPSKNLFNYSDPNIVRGYYIRGDGALIGTFAPNTAYSITGFIPINAGQTLHSNKSQINAAIGVNLYDTNQVLLATHNSIADAVAAVDGFARFTLTVNNTEPIQSAGVQVENGTAGTAVVPYGRNVSGTVLIDGTVSKAKLSTELLAIVNSFVEKIVYDSATPLIVATGKAANSSLDIASWGGQYTKTGISFNAIRLPAGITYNPAIAEIRKWKYIQICVKNASSDATFIAKSSLVDIGGLTTLPELIMPLLTPDLSSFITLNDASFTGSSYWINIYFFNASMAHAFGGNITGAMSNYIAGSSRYNTTGQITSWANYSGFPSLAFEHLLLDNVRRFQHLTELDSLQTKVDSLILETPEIILPDTIKAVVGDTLQLFWRGIIMAIDPYKYDIVVNCTKGAWHPRYFEYTPVIGDVGTTTFQIKVKNSNGVVLASKTCILVTRNAVASPTTLVKILDLGDSLTAARIRTEEAYRRLTEVGAPPLGYPQGKGFTNISYVGRKVINGIGLEGNSGWSWAQYLTFGRRAFTFTVSAVTIIPGIEVVYKDSNNKLYTMSCDYSSTSLKFLVNDMVSTPPANGTLTKLVSGDIGDATITFSSAVLSAGSPLYNQDDELDLPYYVNKWCGGSLDVIYILMTWNGQTGNRTDFTIFTDFAKIFFDHAHVAYPTLKIKLMGVQVPDLKGGVRVNGAPAENTYRDTYGLFVTAMNMNKAYQALANDPAYSSFVDFVNVSSQFDSEYNMPYIQKPVNTRHTGGATEAIGTNDVHPNPDGYRQIADVEYRDFIEEFCQ